MSSRIFDVPSLQLLWRVVSTDPMDFQSWMALLSQVEAVGSPEDAQQAYEGFLWQFPLCFGYWKKYASLARRHPAIGTRPATGGSPSTKPEGGGQDTATSLGEADARAQGIFERAVVKAPYCLDLWDAFVEDMMEGNRGGAVDEVRRVYQRALEAVGDNPRSGRLWRRCLSFEEAQTGGKRRMARLYERAFGYRLAELEVLWVGFRDLVDRTSWDEIAPVDDKEAVTGGAAAEAQAKSRSGTSSGAYKERYVKILEEKRKASLTGRERRESFELRITRPHFHVKPLDHAQLSAWSQFLDFEMSQAEQKGVIAAQAAGRKRPRGGSGSGSGSGGEGGGAASLAAGSDVERLFERCLVPCASYGWLWERYALWKESVWGVEAALEVAQRACSPFLQWRPEALFFCAELLERVGRSDEARGIYQRVLSEVAPGLVEAACKLACFERRCGDRKAADAAYRLLLPPPIGESGSTGRGNSSGWEGTTETTRPYLYMQLARFQHRVVGDAAAARSTFRAAVADIPGSRELWLAFLEFEAAQPQALHTGRVEAAFRMAVEEDGEGAGVGSDALRGEKGEEARRLTVEDRADLWEWFEEFVEDLSMDVAKVMSVRAEHKAWTQAHGTGAHEAASATGGGDGDLREVISLDPADDRRDRRSTVAAAHNAGPSAEGVSAGRASASISSSSVASSGGPGPRGAPGTGRARDVGPGGGQARADQQQGRDQWSTYYQHPQQQHQQYSTTSDAGGLPMARMQSTAPAPVMYATYSSPAHPQRPQHQPVYGAHAVGSAAAAAYPLPPQYGRTRTG